MIATTLINKINESWGWIGIVVKDLIETNDFGNIIFKSTENDFWRICPEELSCEKIANSDLEFQDLKKQKDFNEDWHMENLTQIAINEYGPLKVNEKFCLKMPGVIGGEYKIENIGKIDFLELIAFSGDIAYQIKDLKDGEKIKIEIKN
jgi:hypothetical protein